MKPARESVSNAADPATEQQPCLIITEDDIHLFSCGTWNRSWEKMGAHPDVQDGIAGWRFCVWAPEVAGVSVVGDFNGWNAGATPMELSLIHI